MYMGVLLLWGAGSAMGDVWQNQHLLPSPTALQ